MSEIFKFDLNKVYVYRTKLKSTTRLVTGQKLYDLLKTEDPNLASLNPLMIFEGCVNEDKQPCLIVITRNYGMKQGEKYITRKGKQHKFGSLKDIALKMFPTPLEKIAKRFE